MTTRKALTTLLSPIVFVTISSIHAFQVTRQSPPFTPPPYPRTTVTTTTIEKEPKISTNTKEWKSNDATTTVLKPLEHEYIQNIIGMRPSQTSINAFLTRQQQQQQQRPEYEYQWKNEYMTMISDDEHSSHINGFLCTLNLDLPHDISYDGESILNRLLIDSDYNMARHIGLVGSIPSILQEDETKERRGQSIYTFVARSATVVQSIEGETTTDDERMMVSKYIEQVTQEEEDGAKCIFYARNGHVDTTQMIASSEVFMIVPKRNGEEIFTSFYRLTLEYNLACLNRDQFPFLVPNKPVIGFSV